MCVNTRNIRTLARARVRINEDTDNRKYDTTIFVASKLFYKYICTCLLILQKERYRFLTFQSEFNKIVLLLLFTVVYNNKIVKTDKFGQLKSKNSYRAQNFLETSNTFKYHVKLDTHSFVCLAFVKRSCKYVCTIINRKDLR